ncbi:MAG: tetratricopeptide repeat protein [Nitrospirae bacterium]|nr:tetratricopeptide repeat protein [Nitrospirota bacterium]
MSTRIEQLEKILALDPNDPMTHFGLGGAYGEAQQWEQAVAAYRKAIELKPDYTAAHHGLTEALRALGRTDELRTALEKGIAVGTKTGDHIPTEKMKARLHRLNKEKAD